MASKPVLSFLTPKCSNPLDVIGKACVSFPNLDSHRGTLPGVSSTVTRASFRGVVIMPRKVTCLHRELWEGMLLSGPLVRRLHSVFKTKRRPLRVLLRPQARAAKEAEDPRVQASRAVRPFDGRSLVHLPAEGWPCAGSEPPNPALALAGRADSDLGRPGACCF